KTTPARRPNRPKTRGSGASVETPNTHLGTTPAANHAAAHVTPIPIAPRMRRSHCCMIASDPNAARLCGLCIPLVCQVLCNTTSNGGMGFKSAHRRSSPCPLGHNAPLPLEPSPPASFRRLLGCLGSAIEKVHYARPQTVLGTDD